MIGGTEMVKSKIVRPLNSWQQKLHDEAINRAQVALKLEEKGWSDGELMNHFGVTETTIKRWLKLAKGLHRRRS